MDAQPILALNGINMQYPGVKALDNLSLSFLPGEVHAICGENGAGKSTLIKIVTGAITPTSGEIRYLGKSVEHQDPIASMEAGISCIYQEFNLIPYLSVMENVFFGNEPIKHGFVDYATMRSRTIEILKLLDIDVQPDQKVSELTVGYQQIVEIAKALSREVKVLIMDEPSAPLTSKELVALFRIVKNLREKGVTVIYISHRLEEVFELSDRISIIRDGQFVKTLTTSETTNDELIKLMVGRELVNDYPNEPVELGDVVLSVKNLSSKVLKGISFEVRKGEILGFAGLVGASEARTRDMIQRAEAMAPCVLWIDEIDKGFGAAGDGRSDGGTSQRVLASLLTWMAEKSSAVFVVATANGVEKLPPELLRKGRFDEIFLLNLPDGEERRTILDLQLRRRRPQHQLPLEVVVDRTAGFSGAELEQVVIEAMHQAFSEGREFGEADLIGAAAQLVPLSRTAREQLDALQQWASSGRARPASTQRPSG